MIAGLSAGGPFPIDERAGRRRPEEEGRDPMAETLSLPATSMVNAALPAPRSQVLRNVALAVVGSLLIIAAAKVKVPFWPVPMTLQTFAVVLIAATAGASLGLAAMAAYLVEGALGLPVFASGVGLSVLVGPTAGYLAGMLASMALVGTAIGAF
eukprot:gene35378-45316_t